MARPPYEQLKSALGESRSVLIAFPHTPDAHLETLDRAAAALVLARALIGMGKRVEITSSGFVMHPSFALLPGAETIKPNVPTLHRIVVSLPLPNGNDPRVSHEIHDNELHIAITPDHGAISRDRVRIRTTSFHYDTLLTIGARELSALGALHTNHGDFLKDVLIINIDHHLSNESFGAINCIDHTASSSAEAVTKVIEHLAPEHLSDKSVATMLLAGLLAATRSFRETHVRPGSLETASRLIASGAERERIMNTLFRTRSVAALKLWGRALGNLEHYVELRLASVTITRHDFMSTGATPDDLTDIIHELLTASGETDKALVLYEGVDETVHGILFSRRIPPELLLYPELPGNTSSSRELRFSAKKKPIEQVKIETINQIKEAVQ